MNVLLTKKGGGSKTPMLCQKGKGLNYLTHIDWVGFTWRANVIDLLIQHIP